MLGLHRLFSIWFGYDRLDRKTYILSIITLIALHLALQSASIALLTGKLVGPLVVLSPLLSTRITAAPALSGVSLFLNYLLYLPVIWAGTSMSIRRAVDAGLSPWLGCFYLVPLVNVVIVVVLGLVPTSEVGPPDDDDATPQHSFRDLVVSSALGAALGLFLTALSVYAFGSYGGTLFLVIPFVMGFVVGYVYNCFELHGPLATVGAVALSLVLTFGGLLAFAMEGLVCIAMAAPLAFALAVPGGMVGEMVARRSALRMAHMGFIVLSMPFLMGAETSRQVTPLHEVASAIEIAAPPHVVWPRVVGFSDLPPPGELVFRLGIAYPKRARIEGTGIGAIRHCEFSTGSFVEPITHWEEPSRLSFDVVSQPHPMHEWSPYEQVNAPHLVGNMRSKRGEFRLVALPNGSTRLEGSTWYELEMFPQFYWLLWSDTLVHTIHNRVLEHIKHLAESDVAQAA